MAFLEQRAIGCPYCGESITILIEPSGGAAVGETHIDLAEPYEYIEDCQVCCNPILLRISSFGDTINIETAKEETGF